MAATTEWHGTPAESERLNRALTHWCHQAGEGEHCTFGLMGVRLQTCAAHKMLLDDQRALDGLVYAARLVDKYRQEEGLE